MIQTFTLALEYPANHPKKDQKKDDFSFAEPSIRTIQTILNFSRNLEIKRSKFLPEIEIIKS